MSSFALGFFCGLGYVGLLVGTARLCALGERFRENVERSEAVDAERISQ